MRMVQDISFAALARVDRLGGAAPQTPRDIYKQTKEDGSWIC